MSSPVQSPVSVLAAECRAVEGHHQARLDPAGHCFTVASDSRPGVRHEVRVHTYPGAAGRLWCTCTCPAGVHAAHGRPVPCRHAATVLRRIEREGLARHDGRSWVATTRLAEAVA